ncbi:hypothetical protein GCM10025875_08650 [Litorihabitans aurantiacus]|uniref:Aldehyde dehydrogenase domain-containing protein n=1 Tax=Litorihabitans aurantiacus TaxID=1930061 RepID=A0AA37UHL2_9MICO|nr:hypothetical protein GCM10025875_08650 [Litorihabitans aurantiacus]
MDRTPGPPPAARPPDDHLLTTDRPHPRAPYPGGMSVIETDAPRAAEGPTEGATSVTDAVHAVARSAKVASRALVRATRATKDAALHAMADALVDRADEVVAANAVDVARERERGMSPGLLDRLTLTPERIAAIAGALRDVAALPDPVGEVVRGSTLPNGLRVRQTRVPLGVVGVIYEARPNVTVDVVGLALKSGNAVVLRGGSAAASSNTAIVAVLQDALESQGLPRDAVASIDEHGRPGEWRSCAPVGWWTSSCPGVGRTSSRRSCASRPCP